MNALETIQNLLQNDPKISYTVHANVLTVPPATSSGFTVIIESAVSYYTVAFDGWHAEYVDAEEAVRGFRFGLSAACRLRVNYQGKMAYQWTVEERDASGDYVPCEWIGLNSVGLLIPPLFWLKKRTVYLQNTSVTWE